MWFISEASSEDKDALSECELPEASSEDKDALSECELPHDKTNKMVFAPSEDSDQPGHPPSLIRVFAVRSVGS